MAENDTEKSVADILQSSIIGLMESDMGVYQRIIDLEKTGFFEQHQTAGRLKSLADELITISTEERVDDDESK